MKAISAKENKVIMPSTTQLNFNQMYQNKKKRYFNFQLLMIRTDQNRRAFEYLSVQLSVLINQYQ